MNFNAHETIGRWTSRTMFLVCTLFTALILGVLALVMGYLISLGLKHISLEFFTQAPTGRAGDPGGMKHALVGTGVLILVASVVGIPLGMLAGVYLAEYDVGSWIAKPVRFTADVLAGVPSIVVGILGYELLVVPFSSGRLFGVPIPWLKHVGNQGYNGWAGAAALAFIMIPIVARTTEEMLRLVPGSYREASIALGATKARTILRVVIPSATGSLVTGVMLAIARVAGETAPLLFTALGSSYVPKLFSHEPPYLHPEVLNQPFPSLTQQIFAYATGPYREEKKLAWAGMLVLIFLIFLLNLGIRFTTRRRN